MYHRPLAISNAIRLLVSRGVSEIVDTLSGLTACVVWKRTPLIQHWRRNIRDLLLRFPAPISYRLIVIRVVNGQTRKRLSVIHPSQVLFATNDPDGISIMQPFMQPY